MDLGRTVEAERLKDRMENSRASISETVDELRGAVSQAMDWREYVKTHPGATLGIAATAGVVAGHWLGSKLVSEDPASPRPAPARLASADPPRLLDGSKSRAGARMESLVNLVIDEVADAVETAAIVPLFARLRSFLRSSAGALEPAETGAATLPPAGEAVTGAVGDPHRREGDVPAWATSPPANGRWER